MKKDTPCCEISFLPYFTSTLFAEIPRSRNRSQRFTVLKIFHYFFDSLVQLLVFAIPFLNRIIVDQDIRVDTMVFDNPLARLRIIAGEERYTDICSVHVRQWAANADDSPQVRVPISLPVPKHGIPQGNRSPSDAEYLLIKQTFGPTCTASGTVPIWFEPRRMVRRYGSRERRSRIIGDTFPPPLARSSMIRPSLSS